MANYLNDKVPGISIPQRILKEIETGNRETGLKLASELVQGLKDIGTDGVHLMPVNDVDAVPVIVKNLK